MFGENATELRARRFCRRRIFIRQFGFISAMSSSKINRLIVSRRDREMDAGDDFLTDVTAFVVADKPSIPSSGTIVVSSHINAVSRNAVFDAQNFLSFFAYFNCARR
jgi:hypothetical protein